MSQMPGGQPPLSPDGNYYWDGQAWQPVSQMPQAPPQAPMQPGWGQQPAQPNPWGQQQQAQPSSWGQQQQPAQPNPWGQQQQPTQQQPWGGQPSAQQQSPFGGQWQGGAGSQWNSTQTTVSGEDKANVVGAIIVVAVGVVALLLSIFAGHGKALVVGVLLLVIAAAWSARLLGLIK